MALDNIANTFNGGVTLNSGVLVAATPPANVISPFGTGPITINGGQLSVLASSVTGSINPIATIAVGNNVNISPALPSAFFNVNNNGAGTGTGGLVKFGTLSMLATQTINVTGGNNYKLGFSGGTVQRRRHADERQLQRGSGRNAGPGHQFHLRNGATAGQCRPRRCSLAKTTRCRP